MKIYIIAAVDAQWGISRAGKIPWSIPADMAFFKQMTEGKAVLMGKNTWLETGGLPRRLNIVVSNMSKYDLIAGNRNNVPAVVVPSIIGGVDYARANNNAELYICGGSGIYNEVCLEHSAMIDGVYLNRISRDYKCDNLLDPATVEWVLSLPAESTRIISAIDKSDSAVVKMEFLHLGPKQPEILPGKPVDTHPVDPPKPIIIPIKKYKTHSINMVGTYSLMCATDGSVAASTAVALKDPMTGLSAVLPEGAAVDKIDIYRDGDVSVTGSCLIQLGIVGDTAKYIAGSEGLNTNLLNSGHVIHKNIAVDVGLSAEAELRLTLGAALTSGALIFEIKYSTYA